MAGIIEVDETTIYNCEKGRTEPPAGNFPKIIEFLGYVPYDPQMSFGEKLFCWRRCLGMSQKEFARMVGVGPSTVLR